MNPTHHDPHKCDESPVRGSGQMSRPELARLAWCIIDHVSSDPSTAALMSTGTWFELGCYMAELIREEDARAARLTRNCLVLPGR